MKLKCAIGLHEWIDGKCVKCGKQRPDEAIVRELAQTYGRLKLEGAGQFDMEIAEEKLVTFRNRLAVCKVITEVIIKRKFPTAVKSEYTKVRDEGFYLRLLDKLGPDGRFLDDYIRMCRAFMAKSDKWAASRAADLILHIEGGWERVHQEFEPQEAWILIMSALLGGSCAADFAGRFTEAEARLAISTIMGDKDLNSYGRFSALARVGLPALDTLVAIYREQSPEADKCKAACFICTIPGSLEVLMKR